MPIASFANKVFEVSSDKVYSFNELQFGTNLETETQENPGAKPKTYIKGPGLNTLSIKITVSADLGLNPRAEIGSWKILKDTRTAYPFILGGKPFGSDLWLLKDVQAADTKIDNAGKILSATISLSFEEYVFAGAAKETKTSAGKTAGKKTAKDTTSVYNALSPSQKQNLMLDL